MCMSIKRSWNFMTWSWKKSWKSHGILSWRFLGNPVLVCLVHGIFQLYLSWCECSVAEEVTKPRCGSIYPWPLKLIIPWWRQKDVRNRLQSIGWSQKSLDQVSCILLITKNGWPRMTSFSMVWMPSSYPLIACVYILMHDWIHYSSPKAMCN